MYKKKRQGWLKHIDFIVLDLLIIQLSFVIAYSARFPKEGVVYNNLVFRDILIIITLVIFALDIATNNLHDILKRNTKKDILSVISLSTVSVALITIYLYAMKTGATYSRLFIGYTFVSFAILDLIFRSIYKGFLLRRVGKSNSFKKTIFVLTTKKLENEVNQIIKNIKFPNYVINKICYLDKDFNVENEANYICREWIDEVLIHLPNDKPVPKDFITACNTMGITYHNVLPIEEKGKTYVEGFGGKTVITNTVNYILPWQSFIKRLFDIFASIIGCLCTIVLTIFIGPIIKIKSPGPIFFVQERIGQNGHKFKFYKFRSMYTDAEERKKDYLKQNRVQDGLMFKLDNDPRIIKGIGHFIRKTSIDEFPQFFNVLKGDMSVIGTRPPTLDEWEKYEYHHRARMSTKPGVTGLWQVSGRSTITDFEEVVKLDTEYINNFSIRNDIKIFFKTLKVLLTRTNGAM